MALGEEMICKQTVRESTAKYWISHASYSTDCVDGGSDQMCTITAVLDAGTHDFFSGIRIIIAYQESETLRNVRIEDRLEPNDPQNYDGWSPDQRPRNSYRNALIRHRTRMEKSSELLKSYSCLNGQSSALPLCTVVFELTDSSDDDGPSVSLELRSDTTPETPLRVIYDHAIACMPDRRAFVGLLQLKSHHFFLGPINPLGGPPSIPSHAALASMPTHMVRILPLVAPPSLSRHLPLKIIRRIASFAFSQRESGVRRGLMYFALVCKAWLPVLDIFYEGLGYPTYPPRSEDQPLATAVARTLERNPEKAQLITIFKTWNYSAEGDTTGQLTDAHMTILKLATAVTKISVSSIPPLLVDSFLRTASMLKGVTAFTASIADDLDDMGNVIPRGPTFHLDTSDILNLISHWAELRTLYVSRSQSSDASNTQDSTPVHCHQSSQFSASTRSNRCKIEELHLSYENISSAQILQLVSPSHPRLKNLFLENVSGISNREFLAFLSRASSTLVSLSIFSCNIPRDSEEEEYAIDAVMPKMICLNRAIISGQASLSAMARKPQSTRPGYRCQPWCELTLSLVFADPTYELSPGSVAEALQTSGWGSVMIMHSAASVGPGAWSHSSREMVYRVAKEKGIVFVLH